MKTTARAPAQLAEAGRVLARLLRHGWLWSACDIRAEAAARWSPAADQHHVVGVIVKAPLGQCLADEPAGLADQGRVTAELATDRTLPGDSRRHLPLLAQASKRSAGWHAQPRRVDGSATS